MVQLLMSSKLIELSPFRYNKHNHRRCRSCTPTTLEMACNLFRQLPRWINEHPLSTQVSMTKSLGENQGKSP
jgi:hypothetical protein